MIIAGKTDTGRVRKTNQDEFATGELPSGAAFALVCDGMGGANGGNVASSVAAQAISKGIQEGYSPALDVKGREKLLGDVIGRANSAVYGMSRKDAALSGMGTTVVVCIASENGLVVAHAGDSRAYLLTKDGALRRLTRDHSVVQAMIENGKLTEAEANSHPQKNIITRALGVEETLELDFAAADFEPGAAVLLCSDGLTNHVPEEAISQTAADSSPSECVERLVDTANENGGSDNITVVVLCNASTGGELNG